MTPSRVSAAQGFTLLEVLLALALLAIVGMSVLFMSGESVRNTPILEQRTLARLVADNQMTDIHLTQKWPTLSWQRAEHELAGQQWFVRFRSIKTADNDFRAIDVEVRGEQGEQSPVLATLRSYMVKQG
ncbi:type II secretion system minor pseudopilin GspI [Endozoicomonas acroporae]|uniref:type II secretion system minor pseudopilin GspI n=1 Tax=Endozoicomonas acroporae TaxID=1701104 RepID=UPI000C76A867|nr:type II secretion system minor pseudopilin GspI [Endozoicomonas acroporae]